MKTVVITGASRGIGFATAKKFLDAGYKVIGTSTSGKVPIDSDNLIMFQLDLSSPESIQKAANDVKDKIESIDILINNAAMSSKKERELNVDVLRKILNVNVIGVVDFSERMIPLIKDGSHIINISSEYAVLSEEQEEDVIPSYKISKAALNMYTRVLAKKLKERKIIVSSLDPGWVKTDMGGKEAEREPEEVAEDIYNLAIRDDIETGQFWFKGEKRSW